MKITIFREEAASALAGFHAGPLSWSSWNLENPEKNTGSKDENQQQTQPTYDTGPELNPGHIGGRRALSPRRQPCLNVMLWNKW